MWQYLLRPREQLRSTVMSIMSVNVSVCLSVRISPEPHTQYLPFFVHVAYVCGLVLLRHVNNIGCIAYQREGGEGSAQCG